MIVAHVLWLKSSIFAECNIGHEIMFGIASVERHKLREIGYPYLISFNNLNDFELKDKILDNDFEYKTFKNDKRTIDCINENNCNKITTRLIQNNVINLDLGAFQINYRWHKYDLVNYFDLVKNYNDACRIVENLINNEKDKNLSIYNVVAKYHSRTKELNERYAGYFEKNYEKYYPNLNF